MSLPSVKPLLLPILVGLGLGGCASREFVQQEVDAVSQRVAALQAAMDQANQRIDTNTRWLSETEGRVAKTEAGQAALTGRLDETAAGLARADGKIDTMAAGLAATGQRLDALDARLAAADGAAEGIRQAMAGSDARFARLEGEIAAVKASVPSVTALAPIVPAGAAAPAAPATAGDGNARLDALAALIEAATRRIDENTAAILAASERMKAVEAGLAGSRAGLQAAEAALANTNRRVDTLAAAAPASATDPGGKRLDNLETTLAVAINKIENTDRQLADQGDQIKALDARVGRNEKAVGEATAAAREALERAAAAGKLAQGKLVYETQLTDETAPFAFQSAELTDATRQLLTALANKLKAANEDVFLEIQGHTDNSGPAEANRQLATARAQAVRDYLHDECGLAMHRLAVVSYGEARPLADNGTREGRSKNRRVQIVVLK